MLSPDNARRCKQLIADHGFSGAGDSIMDQAVDCISLFRNESRDSTEIGTSRYGGLPDLPEAIEWPRNADGELLGFFMQLRLSELPHSPAIVLPDTGMLYFFLEEDDCGPVKHRILHCDSATLRRTSPPEGRFTVDVAENYRDFKPFCIDGRLAFDVPGYGSSLFEEVDSLSESAGMQFFDFMDAAHLGRHEQGLNGQLFGYSEFEDGSQFALVAELTNTPATEWRAFWRIDSDFSVGSCIMDAGAFQSYITTRSLQSLDFTSTFALVVAAG